MRNAFAAALQQLAADDPRIVLLSGDIGNRLFDRFKERWPQRFLNCGVAEANMVSVAAGMALCGLRPITYTIASFMTARCYEQIRIDVCYHGVPVVIAGVGAGLGYAANGPTHQSCEDLAILRALPGLAIVCPADPLEVGPALRAAVAHGGPVYLRLGKKGEPAVHDGPFEFTLGRALPLRAGEEVALLANGTMVPTALAVADCLAAAGVSAEVVSFHTVKPLDEAYLQAAFARCRLVVTLEEATLAGGLGSAVAEWLVDRGGAAAPLLRCGTADVFVHEAGGQEHYRRRLGLSVEAVTTRVLAALEGVKR